ncbi:aldehyde dehydrogenase family 7 member B4-like [Ipomoea triloba]|uniref:aldehyde dehydrogenase family 7 member B4-like n=1 Tax=Ipomoea triloba TaxID=35885 RepID=UPI00125DE39B|nr:aldehyde dehydrogenase family 7 member B4-like [Ipomoea triloba]
MSFAKREYEFLREVGIGPRNFGCYVNSAWRAIGPTVYTVNPSNNQAIADVVEASICDYEERKRACYEAAKLWMQIPAPKRGEIVKQIGDVLRAKVYHLGYFVSLEMGKILPERIGEVLEIIDMCDFAVGLSHMMLEKNNLPGAIFHHWSRYSQVFHALGAIGVLDNFPRSHHLHKK